MKDRLLATRYARALLAALPDAAAADRAGEFLTALSAAMGESPDLRDVLLNPAVSRSDRKRVLEAISGARDLPRQVRSFLSVVVDHGRAEALPAIAEVFHELKDESAGIVAATMTTAAPVPEPLRVRAVAAFERLTGRRVRLTWTVEPSLLGGAVTRIGSTVYDGSLRSQLAGLRRKMAGE